MIKNRVMLFRAKSIFTELLIEGSLIQHYVDGGCYIENTENGRVPVYKKTVCQFTGHYAENHTPIFERDIVDCTYFDHNGNDTHVVGIVTWQDWGYVLKPIGKDAVKYSKMGYEEIELPGEDDDTESNIKVIGTVLDYDD